MEAKDAKACSPQHNNFDIWTEEHWERWDVHEACMEFTQTPDSGQYDHATHKTAYVGTVRSRKGVLCSNSIMNNESVTGRQGQRADKAGQTHQPVCPTRSDILAYFFAANPLRYCKLHIHETQLLVCQCLNHLYWYQSDQYQFTVCESHVCQSSSHQQDSFQLSQQKWQLEVGAHKWAGAALAEILK